MGIRIRFNDSSIVAGNHPQRKRTKNKKKKRTAQNSGQTISFLSSFEFSTARQERTNFKINIRETRRRFFYARLSLNLERKTFLFLLCKRPSGFRKIRWLCIRRHFPYASGKGKFPSSVVATRTTTCRLAHFCSCFGGRLMEKSLFAGDLIKKCRRSKGIIRR